MVRFDVLGPSHKGLRNCLSQLQFKSAQLNYSDIDQVNSLLKDLEWAKKILDAHALGEDKFLFPLLQKINEVVFKILEDEHNGLESVQENLVNDLKNIARLSEKPKREELGIDFCRNLNDFIAHYFIHLQSEEMKAIPELWKSYDDQVLIEVIGKFPTVTPPDINMKFAEFMIPALNFKERVNYLMAIKKTSPESIFNTFKVSAQKTLPPKEFSDLIKAVD